MVYVTSYLLLLLLRTFISRMHIIGKIGPPMKDFIGGTFWFQIVEKIWIVAIKIEEIPVGMPVWSVKAWIGCTWCAVECLIISTLAFFYIDGFATLYNFSCIYLAAL